MSYEYLLTEQRGSVFYVTLNRPDLHNAFNEVLIEELTSCFQQVSHDKNVRVVVLAGEGKSFCAGADLSWMGRMAGYSKEENLADARTLQQMFDAIYRCSKPTIARVHGAAMGGGVGLVAACDIAIAAPEAKFAFSEVKLGIIPAVISPFTLQKIGFSQARALFITGERFDAETAYRINLIHQIVPAETLDEAIKAKIKLLLQNGPQAIAASKMLLNDIRGQIPEEVADLTVERIAAIRVSEEGQEGIKAFLEKRSAKFVREE